MSNRVKPRNPMETPPSFEVLRRQQKQIDNQVATINRLLDGGTYDDEMARLHEELAAAQVEIERLRDVDHVG